MEDQNKLFVFERKEVILIFLFIVLIAVISFTLGVRTGKGLSLKSDGYTKQDIETIELKSVTEEHVESTKEAQPTGEAVLDQQTIEQRIKDEMQKLAQEDVERPVVKENEAAQPTENTTQVEPVSESPPANSSNAYAGKYTVQLASHKTQDMAQEFADAFIVKGYDMIINEARIPGKGKWYRVSIGLFNTRQAALKYISENKDLFQDREYTINQL